MRIVELEQSGPAWHEWRAAGIGGSDACVVAEDVQWTTPAELLQVKLGRRTVAENERMARGKRLEPVARRLYIELTGNLVRPCCVVHDHYPWLRASLDGLSEDGRLVLEIKCPSDYAHGKALRGYYPDYYKAQLQHQLMVTGAPLLHYWSYTDSPKFPGRDRAALVVVEPDPAYQQELLRKERRFYQRMTGEAPHP
jgi:putative phage-type endonuclease